LYEAPPGTYLFFGLQAVVVGMAQMKFGKAPRLASIISGAALMPLSFIAVAMFGGDSFILVGVVTASPFLAMLGAGLGYLTGTLIAGCFLVSDQLAVLIKRRSAQGSSDEVVDAEIVADSPPPRE
jgi:hypothetical protein